MARARSKGSFVAVILAALVTFGGCVAQITPAAAAETAQPAARTFELRVAERAVPRQQRVLRITEGERVELRWSADAPLVVHLHGYDIETRVEPGKPAVTAFAARLTGRFPVEIHEESGSGHAATAGRKSGHRYRTLLHVEVHPR